MSPQTTCSADKAVFYMFISGARFFGWHGELRAEHDKP